MTPGNLVAFPFWPFYGLNVGEIPTKGETPRARTGFFSFPLMSSRLPVNLPLFLRPFLRQAGLPPRPTPAPPRLEPAAPARAPEHDRQGIRRGAKSEGIACCRPRCDPRGGRRRRRRE